MLASVAELLSYFSWLAGAPLYATVGIIAVSFIVCVFVEKPLLLILKRTESNTLRIFMLASASPFYVVSLLSLSFFLAFCVMLLPAALILVLLIPFLVLVALGMDFLTFIISDLLGFLKGPGYREFIAMPVGVISLVVAFVWLSIVCCTDIREAYRGSVSEDN